MFKLIRVVILLSILFVIVAGSWMTEKRMAAWERPILVTIYPIAADQRAETLKLVRELDVKPFEEINRFMNRQARPYGFSVTPAFRFQMAPPGQELPPPVPDQFSTPDIAWWSLKMRWWAWMQDFGDDMVQGDVQMFVLYRSVESIDESGISVGMRKGRYGLVKAWAQWPAQDTNLIVFTHELLHVLGATDKYVLENGEPVFPEGYAEPDKKPLFPQRLAEIMGVRIPITSYSSVMADSLDECKIGKTTAEEIGFFSKLNQF